MLLAQVNRVCGCWVPRGLCPLLTLCCSLLTDRDPDFYLSQIPILSQRNQSTHQSQEEEEVSHDVPSSRLPGNNNLSKLSSHFSTFRSGDQFTSFENAKCFAPHRHQSGASRDLTRITVYVLCIIQWKHHFHWIAIVLSQNLLCIAFIWWKTVKETSYWKDLNAPCREKMSQFTRYWGLDTQSADLL